MKPTYIYKPTQDADRTLPGVPYGCRVRITTFSGRPLPQTEAAYVVSLTNKPLGVVPLRALEEMRA